MFRQIRLAAVIALVATTGVAGQVGSPPPRQGGAPPVTMTPVRRPSALAVRLLLALDRLQAMRPYPLTPQLRDATNADRELVQQALTSTDANLRRLAVRGIGRFENPADVPLLAPYMADGDSSVRREAANAIAQAVVNVKDDQVVKAYEALKLQMFDPANPQQAGRAGVAEAEAARRVAIARLHHSHAVAQQLFVVSTVPSSMLIMLRNDSTLEPTAEQINTLTRMARPPTPTLSANAAALDVLIRTGHSPPALLVWATQYRCFQETSPFTCSAPLRQLALQQLDAADPAMAPYVAAGLRDPLPQMRVTALRRVAAAIAQTKMCGPLVEALSSSELSMVKIEAISLLDPRCEEREAAVRVVREHLAGGGVATSSESGWPIRARAIEMLAKLDPVAGREALTQAAEDTWQVHVARVRAAATLRDATLVRRYVDDKHPNVRAEAMRTLEGLGDPAAVIEAMKNLASNDYHLVMAATSVLRRAELPQEALLADVWQVFKRLTSEQKDSSRFPRLEILYAMKDWASSSRGPMSTYVRLYLDDLRNTLQDFDPMVAEAAASVMYAITGTRPIPAPRYRAPQQPDEVELLSLPTKVVLNLDTGDEIEIGLLIDEAPLAAARFVKLASAGFFLNQSFFYNIESMVAINGGSPNGNELSGDARFLRDEIGQERHRAGVIGLLTHGPDTADGRIFIDLTDQPAFDFEYTLFARIVRMRSMEPWPFGPEAPPMMLVSAGKILSVRVYPR